VSPPDPGSVQSAAPSTGAEDLHRRSLHALSEARGHLQKWGLKVLLYAVLAFLVLRLTPSLEKAFESVASLEWQWLVAMLAVETLSEIGFVISWRAIVDRDKLLEHEGRGRRLPSRVAWAQLGGGMLVPGGSYSGVGVGAWILHRLGMPLKQVAQRQFSLSFLNTAIDALALSFCGAGLALGILAGKGDLALTALPAAVAAAGIGAAVFTARRLSRRAQRVRERRPRIAAAVATLSGAVEDTDTLLFHRREWRAVSGAVGYLAFDVLVLYLAFSAIHAHSVPAFANVLMAYIIGALGGSLPLPAGIGAVGGIGGFLILYGVEHNAAVAAAVIYGAIGLIVPLIGGSVAYMFLRREFGELTAAPAASVSTSA
jgi:uncharacterized membrane protein YbhN (UPF0104 family)